MIRPAQHVLLGQGRAGEPEPNLGDGIFFAATYDESDVNDSLTWSRLGAGPHITDMGMIGDGYGARYKSNSGLPDWLTSATGPLTIQATVSGGIFRSRFVGNFDTVLHIGSETTGNAKLKIGVGSNASFAGDNDQLGGQLQMIAESSGGTALVYLPRPLWQLKRIYPELSRGGYQARPQGICFLDADTILVSAHYENQLSALHRIRLSDMVVTGSFEMGYTPSHVSTITRRGDSTVWIGDYSNSRIYEIDVDQSIASGTASVTKTYDASVLQSVSSISWETINGAEYLLIAEYVTSGTSYLYLIPGAEVSDQGVLALSDRFKRFGTRLRSQGVRLHSGLLYLSSNVRDTTIRYDGHIYSVDIEDAAANLSDGSTLPILGSWMGPSEYVEDMDVRPGTNEFWIPTEGLKSVGDIDGWRSIWSAILGDRPAENTYTVRHDGDGNFDVRVNNIPFDSSVTLNGMDIAVDSVSIGGAPDATAAPDAGFFNGVVRNVLIQEAALTEGQYIAAVNGEYETGVLTKYVVSLTNPGAEEGDTTGWTDEIGSMGVRQSNPAPHSGSYYFLGGPNAATTGRQRRDILADTGLTGSEINGATMWGSVTWWQASYGSADRDQVALGVRFLDDSSTEIEKSIAALYTIMPPQVWTPRHHARAFPTDSRYLDLLYDAVRNDGTNLDGYVDDITLTIYRQ